MSITVTVPLKNGDGSPASFSLQLPANASVPLVAGSVSWESGTTATGTVSPSNDGKSALFTPVAAGSTAITATIVQNADGPTVSWEPGHLYYLNDFIVDQNGYVQKVTSAALEVPGVFTPYADSIPGSISLVLTGGSATSGTNDVVISSISASVPVDFIVGQLVTVSGNEGSAAPLNGTWTLLETETNSITLSYNGSSLSGVSVTSDAVAAVLGDATVLSSEYGSPYISGNAQFGTVLNQGDGTNGDWPALALAAESGNFTQFTPGATSDPSANLAPVQYVAAGYSTGKNIGGQDNAPAGIDSPAPASAWQMNTPYATGDFIIDENSNIQKVEIPGTSGTQYPAFADSGTTTDNQVKWVYVSAASLGYTNDPSYERIATYSEQGAGALGTFVLTSVANSSGGVAVYTGTITGGDSSAFAGYVFSVTGFGAATNNSGVFLCSASSGTTLTLDNAAATAESTSGAEATNYSLRAYLDEEGNAHIGWQIAGGTVQFTEPNGIPPAFSSNTSGTTVDGDLIWTCQGTADQNTVYDSLTIEVSSSAGIQPVAYNYLIVS